MNYGAYQEKEAEILEKLKATLLKRQPKTEFEITMLRSTWSLPLSESSYERFPLLIGIIPEEFEQNSSEDIENFKRQEWENAPFTGILCYNAHLLEPGVPIARNYPEPEDALNLIQGITAENAVEGTEYVKHIKGNFNDVLATTPRTKNGQCGLLIYHRGDWHAGLSNLNDYDGSKFEKPSANTSSITEFYNIPPSKKVRESRPDSLESWESITLEVPPNVLQEAIKGAERDYDYEAKEGLKHPTLNALCTWWNTNAPPELQTAGGARVYWYDPETKHFEAGDCEEPPLDAKVVKAQNLHSARCKYQDKYLLFVFFQGIEQYRATEYGSCDVLALDGTVFMNIGEDPKEVDEGYYLVSGIQRLMDQDEEYEEEDEE